MADAYVITFLDRTAGLAVRELSGFTFYVSASLFQRMDERRYRSLKTIHATVLDIFDSVGKSHPGHPALVDS